MTNYFPPTLRSDYHFEAAVSGTLLGGMLNTRDETPPDPAPLQVLALIALVILKNARHKS